jgi:predicted phage-related endonuclease
MRFTIVDAEQRSEMWHTARLGRATGSRAANILAKPKSGNGEAVTRRDYRMQLAIERLTGVVQENDYQSADMKCGVELEPAAMAAYEAHSGLITARTGFLSMNDHMAGCSVDMSINDMEGFAEVKCPKAAIHVEYLRDKRLPPEYVAQLTHNFWVSGAKWADFFSFHPAMPEGLQCFRIRVQRDDAAIAAYEAAVLRFLAEVTVEVRSLQELQEAA